MFRILTRLLARARTRSGAPTKTVAIVVPLSSRPQLTPDEEISLRHLQHYLGSYDIFLLAPPESPIALPGLQVKRFPRRFFGSVAAHNLLLYSPRFYRAFSDYRYIFFYHLDALVFADELKEWCAAGYDFIGPPWIPCQDTPWIKQPHVGNGGFALLNTRAALAVLNQRYQQNPARYWADVFTQNGHLTRPLYEFLHRLNRRFPHVHGIKRAVDEWQEAQNPIRSRRNNDVFWGTKAVRFLPSFKVAPFEAGLRFGFEAAPSTCFELNGRKLPFGCHAWARYDRKFWEPFLLPRPGPVDVRQHAPASAKA